VEKSFDFGGMPRAQTASRPATMVAAGMTGVDDVFSGERNFLDAYANAILLPKKLSQGLGECFRNCGYQYQEMAGGARRRRPRSML